MARWVQWRWIKAGTLPQQLQPAGQPTSDRDALAIRRSSARALTQIMRHALFLRRVTVNILFAQRLGGMSLKDAAQAAMDKGAKLGGTGGLIAIDGQGNVTLPFNTAGMYRGYVDPNGKCVVEIYQ